MQNNECLQHDCEKLLKNLRQIIDEAIQSLADAGSREASLSIFGRKLSELLVRAFEIADVAEFSVLEQMIDIITDERKELGIESEASRKTEAPR
ncbi:MAG: hypothetical protein NXI32_14095 [bacterium]|nr:hypothetical protein [bacterium]